MLSEINQSVKLTYCMASLIWESQNTDNIDKELNEIWIIGNIEIIFLQSGKGLRNGRRDFQRERGWIKMSYVPSSQEECNHYYCKCVLIRNKNWNRKNF